MRLDFLHARYNFRMDASGQYAPTHCEILDNLLPGYVQDQGGLIICFP